jgi:hypothetical protein
MAGLVCLSLFKKKLVFVFEQKVRTFFLQVQIQSPAAVLKKNWTRDTENSLHAALMGQMSVTRSFDRFDG